METGSDPSFPRILLARSARAERLRRRCAAVAAAAVAGLGLLIALGLALLVLELLAAFAFLAAALAAHKRGASGALMRLLESLWRTVSVRVRQLVVRTDAAAGLPLARSSFEIDEDAATAEMAVVATFRSKRTLYGVAPLPTRAQVAHALPQLLPRLQRRIGTVLAGASGTNATSRSVIEMEGSRCNALGVALRRAGRAQQAATLHEAARVIFAAVGESRGEALAANALGVALAEAGKQDAALEQFEQARALLREVGDEQWEGKVLANIGLAKRRVGEADEALDVLEAALAKLSPETEAYRLVERQLKHAS